MLWMDETHGGDIDIIGLVFVFLGTTRRTMIKVKEYFIEGKHHLLWLWLDGLALGSNPLVEFFIRIVE